uniref:Uncharacterized protein n=1 Tax=Arundo donax TaxID=35708 RepID=A0A0A9EA06_ARUDO
MQWKWGFPAFEIFCVITSYNRNHEIIQFFLLHKIFVSTTVHKMTRDKRLLMAFSVNSANASDANCLFSVSYSVGIMA